jgi:hypothetical protein
MQKGSYYPSLTRKLNGDVKSAVLLSFLLDLEIPKTILLEQLCEQTGLSVHDVNKSRAVLKALGLVDSRKITHGLRFSIDGAALRLLPEKPENSITQLQLNNSIVLINKSEIQFSANSDASKSGDENSSDILKRVIDGEFDSEPSIGRSNEVASAILNEWSKLWGKNRTRLSNSRMKVFRDAVKETKVSVFAKAIIGMKWDQWEDRPKYNEWHHVQRNVDRFASMYDDNGHPGYHGEKSIVQAKTKTIRTKTGINVKIPIDYNWVDADTFMAENGYTFNLESRQWEK